ncbi:MAG: lipoate protein ligase C-terminal domain-containing protein [Candidatus Verstraetearchaeota archaeon]|nr:lipoate protein ligase C-terminal domain-containing protein [Candidatus Verstraetearchaeota archaeon]
MDREVVRKFKDGKLVKVKMVIEGGVIKDAKITGDFFAHPEEGIEIIEKELIGKDLSNARQAVESAIGGVTLIGVRIEELIAMVQECLENDR